jgi:HAE1 family hydrophobic/amphiphilic exporter-1
MFSRYFIERPIFAGVIAIVMVMVGLICIFVLPVSQYPDIVPPVVQVTATYPGADPKTIADTVAAPIEQQVNGVDNMLYMSSSSSADGTYSLSVTFELGSDIDMCTVLTQNRVAAAISQLPQEVQRLGVTTKKVSTALVIVVSLYSPDERYDEIFLSNYLTLNLKDVITRIPGVGDLMDIPRKDYAMRIWLDADKLEARKLTVNEVVDALAEQNIQVAAGQIGQSPVPKDQIYQLNVNTLGRLTTAEQFSDIIIKRGEGTRVLRLRDVAEVDLGGRAYDYHSLLNNKPSATMLIYQTPGSNIIELTREVEKTMARLKESFPAGLEYKIVYRIADFVEASIQEVVITLFQAFLLVILVVFIFLQNWRATLIPLIAIPVSLIGTFAVMAIMGFSINMITLFGLVLAIGIVVDDAIVVVENVERNMHENGLGPREAAVKSMEEVSGAVIGTTMVLMAVFVPPVFMGGITGEMFRQFALTIAVATLFSSLNALTLSPALSGLIMKPSKGEKNAFFRWFNRVFDRATDSYTGIVKIAVRRLGIMAILYIGLTVAGGYGFGSVPTGFLPLEDDGLILVNAQLPDGASLPRTMDVMKEVGDIARDQPGVVNSVGLVGYSLIDKARSNMGGLIVTLAPWEERLPKGLSRDVVLGRLQKKFRDIEEAIVFAYTMPPIIGLGSGGGFEMQLLDKRDLGFQALENAGSELMIAGNRTPGLQSVMATFRASYPNLFVELDRTKALSLDVPLKEVFSTMATYLGSTYVNDFNMFSRTWQVRAQAQSEFRRKPEDIAKLKVRNTHGDMVPLGTLVDVRYEVGPMRVDRYNLFPTSKVMGSPAPGYSTGQALNTMEQLADQTLPPGMGYEWTNMAYQQKKASGQGALIFGFAIIMVILILAALYESWTDPFAVVLVVPMAILGAAAGLLIKGMDNNLYTQVGLVLLVGLASKNAILIVEFARDARKTGMGVLEAAVEGSRLRFRAILMTAFSFILGVIPLVIASGAGAVSRQSVGVAVFAGMLGATILGVFFTPAIYVFMQGNRAIKEDKEKSKSQ